MIKKSNIIIQKLRRRQTKPLGSYSYRPMESPSVGLMQASQRLAQEAALRQQQERRAAHLYGTARPASGSGGGSMVDEEGILFFFFDQ